MREVLSMSMEMHRAGTAGGKQARRHEAARHCGASPFLDEHRTNVLNLR